METAVHTTTKEGYYSIPSPSGTTIEIPVSYDPESDVFSHLRYKQQIRAYYQEHGFVVQRNVIPAALCDAATSAFKRQVKPYQGFFYRQATGNPERHIFKDNNFMMNAVMNIQDLDRNKFAHFQDVGMQILTHPNIREVLDALMQEEAIIAQTMYFEGNPVTWPHQDKDYLDANKPGAMVAAWVALEDIMPGAGRFYVYPGSHKIDIEKIGTNLNIILDREAYKKLVVDTINERKLVCEAPALKKGDVLFWHGKTIHGSLATTQPEYSRQSFTAHYMPVSRSLLQLQVRQKKLLLREVNGMKVNFPKDQNQPLNKMIFFVETTFPKLFRAVKRRAIELHGKQQRPKP